MKKILQISLGIVTSVGGFLEIGSVTTAAVLPLAIVPFLSL